jgi:hypothetical protein
VSTDTLLEWTLQYRRNGFTALAPKPRQDRGQARVIPAATAALIERLERENPHRTGTALLRELALPDEQEISASTLYRFLRARGLTARQLLAAETGYFMVLRQTIGKRMTAKLKDLRQKLRERMHESIKGTLKWLKSVVRGYYQYHAVPRNEYRLKTFRHEVLRMWLWTLRRRSQRTRWTWERFEEKLGSLIPVVEVLHPYPDVRFASTHPSFGRNIQGRNRVR